MVKKGVLPRLIRSDQGLTDDVVLLGPRASSVRAYLRDASDRLAGADPGLKQLRNALQAVLSIALAVGVVDIFVHLTGALQHSTSGNAPAVAVYNHGLLIVSMLIAGIVAMMAGFTVNDSAARDQVISTLILPAPMIASMALGLVLGSYRIVSLIFLVALLAVAVYVRRWGPRGFAAGLVAFNGGFLGFFLHTELSIRDIGWLAADLGIGVVASLVVRFALFRPDQIATLKRMRRSWRARADRLLELSATILEVDDAHRLDLQKRLQRQVVRLNESTLIIDAQLVESVPDLAAQRAIRLFDAELPLSNCARFAAAIAGSNGNAEVRGLSAAALRAVLDDTRDHVEDPAIERLRSYEGESSRITLVAHRLAESATDYATARSRLLHAIEEFRQPTAAFVPAVQLNAGFLPGSAPVSLVASTTSGRGGWLDRTVLAPHIRAAIQISVAATLAIVLGDIVSGARLYWAVLATFLAFMATTNSGEQARKALFRVAGTAIGIIVGDLLVHVTGGHVWSSLLIVLIALFFGIYLIRVNYTFMVIAITVTMSQLYAQLGEFSWHLLVLRLVETAIGVGAVVLTVTIIVPLRPQRVLTAGVLLWFQALTDVLNDSLDRLLDGRDVPLRSKARQLDAAYAALEATATPLHRATFGRNSAQLTEIRSTSWAARNYVRSLATEAEATGAIDSAALPQAVRQLRAGTTAIEDRIRTGNHGSYTRSASQFEVAARALPSGDSPARFALRDLTLLDGTLARLATALQMDVSDFDTTEAVSTDPRGSELADDVDDEDLGWLRRFGGSGRRGGHGGGRGEQHDNPAADVLPAQFVGDAEDAASRVGLRGLAP